MTDSAGYFCPSGGKSQTKTSLAGDQHAAHRSVRALLINYRDKRPLVLLVDDKYLLFPYDLARSNVTYAVLGLYWITGAWGIRFSDSLLSSSTHYIV